jgi:predicted HAD superfamily phosphohydrolase
MGDKISTEENAEIMIEAVEIYKKEGKDKTVEFLKEKLGEEAAMMAKKEIEAIEEKTKDSQELSEKSEV